MSTKQHSGAGRGKGSFRGRYGSDGGRGAAHTRSSKEVPHAGLVMLKADGSNITSWTEALANHYETTYGRIGKFVLSGTRYVRVAPQHADIVNDLPQATAAQVNDVLKSAYAEHFKMVARDAEHYAEMFGLMQQVISVEGMDKVKADTGYAAAREADDPVALLTIVKKVHSICVGQMTSAQAIWAAQKRYSTIRQLPGVSMGDYKAAFELVLSNMRALQVNPLPTEEQQARHFLMGLDSTRHGEYINLVLNNELSGIGVFPATIQEVIERAGGFIRSGAQRTVNAPMAYAGSVDKTDKPCFNCGKSGHWRRECPETVKQQPTESVMKATTSAATGEEVDKTSKKKKNQQKKKKKDDAVTRNGYAMDVVDPYAEIFGYAFGADVQELSSRHPRAVSLDSLANHSFGWNEDLFDDMHDEEFVMRGVGGTAAGSRAGRMPCFGPVVITPKSRVNALALCDAEKYQVEYEQGIRYTVTISDDLVLEFTYCEPDKSYTCIFTDEIIAALRAHEAGIGIHTITVMENEKLYSKSEVHGARVARQLMRRLHYPSDAVLVNMLASGRILNAPVTPHDVLRATSIYGKDVPTLKGKTVDHGPVATRDMIIPKSLQKEQHVHADLFNWKGNWFILFVVKPLGLLMVEWIPNSRSAGALKESINKMLGKIRARGYIVERITTDPEKALAKLDGLVDCAWDTVGSRDHEEHAEREIKFLKERMRCTEHGVPFRVANRFARWVAYSCVAAINASRSVENNISPRESFTGVKLDYKRDLRVAFGDYAQVSIAESGNSGPGARTVSAIALCHTGNSKGTVVWYDLKKETEFRATTWTPLPMPDIVFERLEQMADRDNSVVDEVPKALKGRRRARNSVTQIDESEPRVEQLVEIPTHRDTVPIDDSGVFTEVFLPDADAADEIAPAVGE